MSAPSAPETSEANSLFQAAVKLHQAGDLRAAADLYERTIALEPRHVFAHGNLGAALRGLGRPEAAVASYDAAIALRPDYADALSNRGNALLDLQRFDAALASFQAALALKPGDPFIQNNCGNLLLRKGSPQAALARFDAAIALKPDHAIAHFNRGNALRALGKTEAAIGAYEAAIDLQPSYAEALVNLSDAQFALERHEAALASLDRAIALKPNDAGAHFNRGNILQDWGRTEPALQAFEAAIALDPAHEEARWNRSLCLLRLGRYAEGWADYERRWNRPSFVQTCAGQVTAPLRDHLALNLRPEDLAGRHVLLVAEEAIGDVVMFASMLPDLLSAAAKVSFLCEARLQRLMAHSFPDIALIDPRADPPSPADFDRVVALGSLGPLFRGRAEDFPRRTYLSPRPMVRDQWRERLGPKTTRLRVGLSWRGGTAATGMTGRSIPLETLSPLLRMADCEFVSLQYGDHGAEIAAANAALPRPIRTFPPGDIEDFEDLAGLVQALDLVVSVQTAVIHLAGALGAPCLAMIPPNTSWKYGSEPRTMPWYGSVRLFRQDDHRDWPAIIARVAEAVRHHVPV